MRFEIVVTTLSASFLHLVVYLSISSVGTLIFFFFFANKDDSIQMFYKTVFPTLV